ncbi:uncharacterized protein LOC117071001 [Trachypithecus francoisi]|uniref:uncharacterized protein LOC117071001 n=1 Tax=Trachypithecus francoisi TaxID=54180 RepID=UPI00141BBFD4|nr:uncharacterized protein LOC117071001 [Trachypithecus francoisi]
MFDANFKKLRNPPRAEQGSPKFGRSSHPQPSTRARARTRFTLVYCTCQKHFKGTCGSGDWLHPASISGVAGQRGKLLFSPYTGQLGARIPSLPGGGIFVRSLFLILGSPLDRNPLPAPERRGPRPPQTIPTLFLAGFSETEAPESSTHVGAGNSSDPATSRLGGSQAPHPTLPPGPAGSLVFRERRVAARDVRRCHPEKEAVDQPCLMRTAGDTCLPVSLK